MLINLKNNTHYSRDKVFMLSALPNLFFIKCANSLGLDITLLKCIKKLHINNYCRIVIW